MTKESKNILKAKNLLAEVQGKRLSVSERANKSLELAASLLEESQAEMTRDEKEQQEQLARMMNDPKGKAFTALMTDECFRSQKSVRIADQIVYLLGKYGIPEYLSASKQKELKLFKSFGTKAAPLLIPLVKHFIRKETSKLILPAEERALEKFVLARTRENVRVNINHLGEAILGEKEAEERLNVYLEDLSKPEIEYISVKISTIFSQLNLLDWDKTVAVLCERLRKLYRAASKNLYTLPNGEQVPKFVNLDMEEYRDLYLTVAVFRHVLDEQEFEQHSAGIVLQSYIPDSFRIQQDLTVWALQRVAKGGASIKIRIVKGANLAMERVEASLQGWPQAPYPSKKAVDANFKKMVNYACEPERARAVNVGIGSHNIFDISYALILRAEKGVEDYVGVEMLEGMADALRRTVQKLTETILLYSPVSTKDEFQNAVAYLIRRLDENTGSENFLRYAFGLHPGSPEWLKLSNEFMDSCQEAALVTNHPRRTQNRLEPPLRRDFNCHFSNEPDTDWTLPQNQSWALNILNEWSQKQIQPIPLVSGDSQIFPGKSLGEGYDPSYPDKVFYRFAQGDESHVDKALNLAQQAQKGWGEKSAKERGFLLAEVGQRLRRQRGNLIGAMVADTGKTVAEADVEISEAIDFVDYYRRAAEEAATLSDIFWKPKGTVVVTPPWNFPCSIPVGGIAAALAAGNCVLFKPANEAILVAWTLVQCFWDAGVPLEVLQFLPCEDDPVGSTLIKDSRVAAVVLTGSTATAKLFMKMRPGIDLMAETGGKNAMIVTGMADRDLAIKNIIHSAFGHAGQKCSACSLLILESEVYEDEHFLQQLSDAAASLKVGSPWDLGTKIPPLIRPASEALLRGLTTLEEGESWLLEPKQDGVNPNLWSPGIKLGVKEGSFSHTVELFGPMLSLMRAHNLDHGIRIANSTLYGLTSGLQSLDEREHLQWYQGIEAGNYYINRTITGAIVRRQPFGGCKQSSFGPGAKAGGPNYVMQLMKPIQINLPKNLGELPQTLKPLNEFVQTLNWEQKDKELWKASLLSYTYSWDSYFSQGHDPSQVIGQDNHLFYRPHSKVIVRVNPQDNIRDVLRVVAAALICGTPLEISTETSRIPNTIVGIQEVVENEQVFCARIASGSFPRVRFISQSSEKILLLLAERGCNVNLAPVMANGRIELLHMLREACLSIDYHRYGYLGEREGEPRAPLKPSKLEEEEGGIRCCCFQPSRE